MLITTTTTITVIIISSSRWRDCVLLSRHGSDCKDPSLARRDFWKYGQRRGVSPYLHRQHSGYYCPSSNRVVLLLGPPPATSDVQRCSVVHEVVHLLCFNCGLLRRDVKYPWWLVEGVAVSFEAAPLGECPFGTSSVLKGEALRLPCPERERGGGGGGGRGEERRGSGSGSRDRRGREGRRRKAEDGTGQIGERGGGGGTGGNGNWNEDRDRDGVRSLMPDRS